MHLVCQAGRPSVRPSVCLSVCGVKLDLDTFGYHLLTCNFGGGPVWQHNSLVATWSKCLNELQIPNQIEPRNRYINSEDRPDIVAFDPVDYSSADLDVSMAHPLSGDSMKGAAAESGYAAKKREVKKEQKYNQEESQSLKAVICSAGLLALRLLGPVSRRLPRPHIKKSQRYKRS